MAESVNQYELAAEQRLFDAMAIALTDGREISRGSIYLYGYVVEMVLKASYFRVAGADPAEPVSFVSIARSLGKGRLSATEQHSLPLLHMALLIVRAHGGRVLPPSLADELSRRVERAAKAWSVGLRYDGRDVPTAEPAQMYEDAAWFFAHRALLA